MSQEKDRFGRDNADNRLPESLTLDLDGGFGDCVEAFAGLCELASHHG